jgi:nicotinamide-nucleotide amidase
MPDINKRQALVPRGATPLANPNGTAPGLLIEARGQLIVLLPGPPRELKPMFETDVVPRLAAAVHGRHLVRRVIKVTNRSESQVEEIAHPIYSALGDDETTVSTTILAMPGQIELHLTATGADAGQLGRTLDDAVRRLADALGRAVFSVDGRSLEAVVGDLLRERSLRIAVAESCTGGLVLGRLTDVPGSSGWVVGGVVAYDDVVKVNELGVDKRLLDEHGAVSEPVARAMAEGVKSRLGADVGVGVTGIAGPAGGSTAKPVGTVVVAVAYSGTAVRKFMFPGDREAIRRHSTAAALDMVRQAIGVRPGSDRGLTPV